MYTEISRPPIGVRTRILAFLTLTKPRVMELLLVTTAPTMFLAERGVPNLTLMLATLIGGAASAGSASVFNMYWDRDMDARMARTAHRPLVTGAVSPRAALVFAWSLAVFSSLWFGAFVSVAAALLSVTAIVWYVVLYTMVLKRRTPQNIVWGGAAGCFPVLIAWVATTDAAPWPALVLFLLVFLWTPAHYWPLSVKYRDDYRRVGVPMLGAVREQRVVAAQSLGYAAATVLCSLALVPVGGMGAIYLVTASAAGLWFLAAGVRYLLETRDPRGARPRPMRVFVTSNVYLAVIFVAVAVDALVVP